MTGDPGLAADRASFREHCIASHETSLNGDIETADRHVDQLAAIAQRYGEAGRAGELLSPLLDDPSPRVRYAAGGHLMRQAANDDDRDRGLHVLEDLRDHDESLVGLDARLALDYWRRQHQ